MIVKVVVAAEGFNGPDLFFCKVECTEEQYDNGDHYDTAKLAASDNGYEGSMVAFDENDDPKPLFGLFEWKTASCYITDCVE